MMKLFICHYTLIKFGLNMQCDASPIHLVQGIVNKITKYTYHFLSINVYVTYAMEEVRANSDCGGDDESVKR
jgi:hypothetical protein